MKKQPKPKRGRPPLPASERFKRVLITLDPESYAHWRKLRNRSAWVREQLRAGPKPQTPRR
jgi:hypothetical protein